MEGVVIPADDTAPAKFHLRFIAPQVPPLVGEPPAGPGWIHEIKQDGYRTLLLIGGGRARTLTRRGHDWSERYEPVCTAARDLGCRAAILDGEIVVQDGDGRSDFAALPEAIRTAPERLIFVAFDLLHLDGNDFRRMPLTDRRRALRGLLAGAGAPFLFSDDVADGAGLFAAAERLGLEGIASKRADSRYRSGPSTAWLKSKCMTQGEFVVVGMERNEGGPPFALMARESDGGLAYCGSAFVTLAQPARDGETDLNGWMVQQGQAVAYRQYSTEYVLAEKAAQGERVGLLQGEFESPWDWRRGVRRTQEAAKPAAQLRGECRIKGNISRNGQIYHLPGQEFYDRTRIDESEGERWFCSEEEAQAAGWRRARR